MVALAMHYAGVLSRFGRLKQSYTRSGNPAWYGRCPVCQDRSTTHLRLWVGDSGRLHAKCYGGQCAALSRGAWWRSLLATVGGEAWEWFPEGHGGGRGRQRRRIDVMAKIVATYDYRDAKGRLLFQCVKFDPAAGLGKNRYRRPAYGHDDPKKVLTDSDGNKWVWDGAGLDLDKLELGEIVPADPVLYRLPELMAADRKQPVLIAEGETDVETLRSLGFVSVCNPHGAGNFPEELGHSFECRRCVVFEDNDLAGRKHSAWVSGVLIAHGAASARLVRFRDFTDHFDVTDWVRRDVFPEAPAESWKMPAYIAGRSADEMKRAKRMLANLVKFAPVWSILSAEEERSRLAALDGPTGEPQTLERAMADQYPEAA